MIEKRQLLRALKEINSRNPFSDLAEKGYTTDEIKRSIRAVLAPHFENESVLNEHFPLLVPEVVNLAFIVSDSHAQNAFDGVQETYRKAALADPNSCFKACGEFEKDVIDGLSRLWSHMYLEHDKADLPLDELRQEAFRNIGDIIEGCLKPFLKEHAVLNRLARGKNATYQDVHDLPLGTIVNALKDTINSSAAFAPPPWGLRLNDWRNIAHHHTSRLDGNEILATYNVASKEHEVRLTRTDLLEVLRRVALIFNAIRTARTLFVIDNIDHVKPHIDPSVTPRVNMSVISFVSAIGAEGFEIHDLKVTDSLAEVTIQDMIDQPPRERMIHASQFVFPLWWYFQKEVMRIKFLDNNGNVLLTAETTSPICQAIANGEKQFTDLANHVNFEIHQS